MTRKIPSHLLAVLMLGAVCQVGQVLLLRELLIVFHGNELSIGLILAAWLAWVGVGSRMGAVLVDRVNHPRHKDFHGRESAELRGDYIIKVQFPVKVEVKQVHVDKVTGFLDYLRRVFEGSAVAPAPEKNEFCGADNQEIKFSVAIDVLQDFRERPEVFAARFFAFGFHLYPEAAASGVEYPAFFLRIDGKA